MKLSTLYAKTTRAVKEFDMIKSGDKVAVGLSGGKDSLTLLYALHGLSKQKDADFSLEAVMIDMGFEAFDYAPIKDFCSSLDIRLTIIETNLADIIFNKRDEKNPCSLCTKMRRGILNTKLKELGCNKLAYGHHRDDFINTTLLALVREGRFHTMKPNMYMSRACIHLIRPLFYVEECEIIELANTLKLPIAHNPCPKDGNTDRALIANFLKQTKGTFPDIDEKIFHAIKETL